MRYNATLAVGCVAAFSKLSRRVGCTYSRVRTHGADTRSVLEHGTVINISDSERYNKHVHYIRGLAESVSIKYKHWKQAHLLHD